MDFLTIQEEVELHQLADDCEAYEENLLNIIESRIKKYDLKMRVTECEVIIKQVNRHSCTQQELDGLCELINKSTILTWDRKLKVIKC